MCIVNKLWRLKMTYIKFNDVNDAQAYENACVYADEIGVVQAVVLTDTGKAFSTQTQLSNGKVYFESDSFSDPKWGKVVAWTLENKPALVDEPVNLIEQILCWFKTAKPNPTDKDIATQVGAHFEEVAEMEFALGVDNTEAKMLASSYYNSSSIHADENGRAVTLPDGWKEQLLDALCDQIVTAVGVAYMVDMGIEGALAEIIRSNNSKLVDGKPMLNEHGKLVKPDTYSPPNLEPFLGDKA